MGDRLLIYRETDDTEREWLTRELDWSTDQDEALRFTEFGECRILVAVMDEVFSEITPYRFGTYMW